MDLSRLREAVIQTINAHPYVKTTFFLSEEGEIRAKRRDDLLPAVEIVETDALPNNLVRFFDLTGGDLYRACIYKTTEGNYLFLDFHHILCDGTSEGILLEDINAAYDGKALETETYTGYEAALTEEKLRQTEAYGKAKAYYDNLFDGVDTDFLPIPDVDHTEGSS